MLLEKSISYFVNIVYNDIFLNFGVISFINKEMVSLFQLHTYKFGLVYVAKINSLISCAFVSASYVVEETRKHLEDLRSWKDYHCPAHANCKG